MKDDMTPEEQRELAEEKFSKAASLWDMGDIDEALSQIRAALALHPGSWKFHYNIGFLYWQKGLYEVAINHYKLFIRYAEPKDPDIPIIQGRIKYLNEKIIEEREAAAKKLRKTRPRFK